MGGRRLHHPRRFLVRHKPKSKGRRSCTSTCAQMHVHGRMSPRAIVKATVPAGKRRRTPKTLASGESVVSRESINTAGETITMIVAVREKREKACKARTKLRNSKSERGATATRNSNLKKHVRNSNDEGKQHEIQQHFDLLENL